MFRLSIYSCFETENLKHSFFQKHPAFTFDYSRAVDIPADNEIIEGIIFQFVLKSHNSLFHILENKFRTNLLNGLTYLHSSRE